MSGNSIVLDANILIRAVLGNKVRNILLTHCQSINFFTPISCMNDAEKYLPEILKKRSIEVAPGMLVLETLSRVINVIDENVYQEKESESK